MIEKIARRAGGFASTTALRWMGAGAEVIDDVTPGGRNRSHKHGGRLVVGAAGAVALLSSSKVVRTGLERGLRTVSEAVRAAPSKNGARNGSKDLGAKTRAELYELAKKADLPGRSAMSKDELARALQR